MSEQRTMPRRFTPKQGQYLAFIHHYTLIHGQAPAEADIQGYFRTTAPTIHQMVVALAKNGLIARTPGQARSIVLRVAADELPPLGLAGTPPPAIKATPSWVEAVTRTACTVITKLFEQCDAYPLDDSEFLPLLGCVVAAVEQELLDGGLAASDVTVRTRRVEDCAAGIYVALCARNDPERANAQEAADTCRRLMARGRGVRR
jgi:hypothetical protein